MIFRMVSNFMIHAVGNEHSAGHGFVFDAGGNVDGVAERAIIRIINIADM